MYLLPKKQSSKGIPLYSYLLKYLHSPCVFLNFKPLKFYACAITIDLWIMTCFFYLHFFMSAEKPFLHSIWCSSQEHLFGAYRGISPEILFIDDQIFISKVHTGMMYILAAFVTDLWFLASWIAFIYSAFVYFFSLLQLVNIDKL